MSSEMRELVKEMRAGTPCYVAKVGGGRCVNGAECFRCAERLDWADRLERAILARTEAGADRPVAEISELSGAKLIVLYSADEIGHLPKGTKLYTHPQDASGDAVTGRVNGYMFSARAIEIITDGEVPEWITKAPGLRVTITAMQAKEAK